MELVFSVYFFCYYFWRDFVISPLAHFQFSFYGSVNFSNTSVFEPIHSEEIVNSGCCLHPFFAAFVSLPAHISVPSVFIGT